MKKLALISALLVASWGVSSAAGLNAAWTNCDGAGGTKLMTFSCDEVAGDTYELFHNFTIDAAITGVIAGQGIVDFNFDPSIVAPPWWELSTGGCNDGGLDFNYLRGSTCSGSSTLFCGTSASICSGSGVAGIGFQYLKPNRNRAIVALARPSTSPVNLTAARHYAWRIIFLMTNANGTPMASCPGCNTACTITWNNFDIFDNVGGKFSVNDAAPASTPSACANPPGTTCDAVPVQTKTWGQLKALYR